MKFKDFRFNSTLIVALKILVVVGVLQFLYFVLS
jgi:hypothetical protein